MYAMLLTAGRLMPAVIVFETNSEIGLPLSTVQNILHSSHLGHTKLLAVGDLGGMDLDLVSTFGERLHVIDSAVSDADLRDRVRHMLADAIMLAGVPTSLDPVHAIYETSRLRAVSASGLLDTPSEESFDEVTRLTATALGTPIALVTLLTEDRQIFKSHWGIDQNETPRSWAFCNETIMQHDVFVVDDATNDARFANNPLVVADPKIRFYAGVPIRDVAGFALGALCVIDRVPRRLTQTQRNTLLTLGRLTSDRVNVRIRERQLRWAKMDRS
jgi:GAF domain-containing protein